MIRKHVAKWKINKYLIEDGIFMRPDEISIGSSCVVLNLYLQGFQVLESDQEDYIAYALLAWIGLGGKRLDPL